MSTENGRFWDDPLCQSGSPVRTTPELSGRPRGPRVVNPCSARGWSSTARHGLDISSGQGLASDAPTPALDLFDDHPGDRTHRLALDGNHRVGELANHLLLLGVREDAF